MSFVGRSRVSRLNYLWCNDLDHFAKGFLDVPTASLMTDGFELPVTEGCLSLYLINIHTSYSGYDHNFSYFLGLTPRTAAVLTF